MYTNSRGRDSIIRFDGTTQTKNIDFMKVTLTILSFRTFTFIHTNVDLYTSCWCVVQRIILHVSTATIIINCLLLFPWPLGPTIMRATIIFMMKVFQVSDNYNGIHIDY